MAEEFKFPDVGEGITEGEVVKWLVNEGEEVKEDQALVEVETDKAVVELPSPWSGTVLKLHAKEGGIVKVGQTLVTIGKKGEKIEKPVAKKPSVSVVGELEEAPEEEEEVKAPKAEVIATPAVRKLARDLKVDLAEVTGTGPGGRITKEDVEKFAGEKVKAVKITKKYDFYGYIERVSLRGIRRSTAKRMSQSAFTAPHVTHMDEADVTHLVEIRSKEKEGVAKKGVKLTYLPFIIKAVVASLKEHPYLNATLDEETEEIVLKKYYNIGIAVDIKEGLMVPVIKGADQKGILELAKEIETLAKAAIARKIDLADLKGGTFTITNVGVIGGIYATPIINYPEVAILATGKIYDKPVLREGKIEIKKILPLSLSFDHRVIDGAEAARFVNTIIRHLEDPHLFLVEG